MKHCLIYNIIWNFYGRKTINFGFFVSNLGEKRTSKEKILIISVIPPDFVADWRYIRVQAGFLYHTCQICFMNKSGDGKDGTDLKTCNLAIKWSVNPLTTVRMARRKAKSTPFKLFLIATWFFIIHLAEVRKISHQNGQQWEAANIRRCAAGNIFPNASKINRIDIHKWPLSQRIASVPFNSSATYDSERANINYGTNEMEIVAEEIVFFGENVFIEACYCFPSDILSIILTTLNEIKRMAMVT